MSAEEKEEGRSFKVEDRRRFSAEGEARPEAPADRPAEADKPADAARAATRADRADVQIDFASFVVGLSTQALVHLGEVRHPDAGAAPVDLDAARQIIDILAMLRTKTEGNLDSAEATLLENALYDLRMRFVQRARKASS